MKRIFKRNQVEDGGTPIEFINLSESSLQLPNQNINPSRAALILMANPEDEDDDENHNEQPKTTIAIHTPIKLRKFTGSHKDTYDIEDWARDFVEACDANQWRTNAQKVSHLKQSLDGLAMHWFRAKYGSTNTEDISVDDVLDEMKAQFGSARPALMYLKQIKDLDQREDEPVQDYYCKMIRLLSKAGIALDSTQAVDYVIAGLKPSLQRRVYGDTDKYPTCDDLYRKLKNYDEASHQRKRTQDLDEVIMAEADSGDDHSQRSPEYRLRSDSGSRMDSRRSPRFNRRAEALRLAQPPQRFNRSAPRVRFERQPSQSQTQSNDGPCFRCNEFGHWAWCCPHTDIPRVDQGNWDRGPASRTPGPSYSSNQGTNMRRGQPSRWSPLHQQRR
jgi:hypothetical protein